MGATISAIASGSQDAWVTGIAAVAEARATSPADSSCSFSRQPERTITHATTFIGTFIGPSLPPFRLEKSARCQWRDIGLRDTTTGTRRRGLTHGGPWATLRRAYRLHAGFRSAVPSGLARSGIGTCSWKPNTPAARAPPASGPTM